MAETAGSATPPAPAVEAGGEAEAGAAGDDPFTSTIIPDAVLAVPEPVVDLKVEVNSRRSFAICAHPDAGKTTLTEKVRLVFQAYFLA